LFKEAERMETQLLEKLKGLDEVREAGLREQAAAARTRDPQQHEAVRSMSAVRSAEAEIAALALAIESVKLQADEQFAREYADELNKHT
jgi:predicted nucleic acid-binding protein